ncbi:MAG: hypothetical protein P4L85_01870 [Paludisphaera borealis]|uniref:hypothetical protein n=1 Tax=Paludisphaera borealis TaxID=1387353 RepID=UPI00284FC415|nr:hypothetical protein [Paludisphaera borealis]MDR3618068.1 hypothetical protein [Paludisphaera borealis]
MSKRRKSGTSPRHESPPPADSAGDSAAVVKVLPRRSFFVELLQRLFIAALCLGAGYGLWRMGRNIIRTGEYNYVLESAGRDGRGEPRRNSPFTRETVHATGDWAREQAFGFMAAGATLAYWGSLVLLSSVGPFTNPLVWNPRHTAMLAVSLIGCIVAVVAFFPPWRIGTSMSCNAFYLVLAASIYLATIRDRAKLKEHSQKIFPALIMSAALVGSFSSGYAVGIIAGIFLCLLLAFQVAMLIPKVRAELMEQPGRLGKSTAAS